MYSTQDRVEAYLERELTEHEVTMVDEAISKISDFINTYTNREWLSIDIEDDEIEEEVSDRYFDGTGSKELYINDFSILDSVTILDSQGGIILSFELATDWILYPLNKGIKQSIFLRNYHFPVGQSNVKVSALWGGGNVPDGVVSVCTALVANFLQGIGEASFQRESIEGYSYELGGLSNKDQDLVKGLDVYKKFIL